MYQNEPSEHCSRAQILLFLLSRDILCLGKSYARREKQHNHAMMRVKFDYFDNKSERKSKATTLDDLNTLIKCGKYGSQCCRLSCKLAIIPSINTETL
jgi:hypothetical protein